MSKKIGKINKNFNVNNFNNFNKARIFGNKNVQIGYTIVMKNIPQITYKTGIKCATFPHPFFNAFLSNFFYFTGRLNKYNKVLVSIVIYININLEVIEKFVLLY
jgi:hypothetical protein